MISMRVLSFAHTKSTSNNPVTIDVQINSINVLHCCIILAGTVYVFKPVPKRRKHLPAQVSIARIGGVEHMLVPLECDDKRPSTLAQASTSKKRRKSSWI